MTDEAYNHYPHVDTQHQYYHQHQQHYNDNNNNNNNTNTHNQQHTQDDEQRRIRRMRGKRLCRLIVIPIFLIVIFCALTRSSGTQSRGGASHSNAILVSDIKALTLNADRWTKSSRVSSIPQLECIGGSASHLYNLRPKVVQCTNKGSDGSDVQWECKASLDSTVRFGKLDVSCEGFGYAGDPYVLKGSCGLRYELEYTSPESRNQHYQNESSSSSGSTIIVWILIIGFVMFIFWPSNNNTHGGAHRGASGPHGPGYPPGAGPYGGPGGYYPGSAPGTYPAPGVYPGDPYYGPQCQPGGWRPGFWSGAGLGYLFGRQNRNHYNYGHHYQPSYGGGGWNSGGSSYRSSSSSGSGVSTSSTGYASTSSR
ncbi:hypothetical protein SAMD00019534_017570, partial [Acytostelium subglobosum LB1]|uniref:hypothetical protein n=1 Tax=Acytostelium subglobosum LB1 TaxID=1410327 RepID=UPI0006451DFE